MTRPTRLACALTATLLLVCAPDLAAQSAPADGSPAATTVRAAAQQPRLPAQEPGAGPESGPTEDAWMKGRFLVGAGLRVNTTPDADLGSTWRPGAVFSYRPRPGWGPAFSLSWFRSDIVVPLNGVPTIVGTVRVRPVMAGIGYGIRTGRLLTTFKGTVGYTFNKAELREIPAPETFVDLRITRTWAAHPSVNVVYPLASRLALVGSAGYVITKPSISVDVTEPGGERRRVTGQWTAQYVTLGVGIAVSVF